MPGIITCGLEFPSTNSHDVRSTSEEIVEFERSSKGVSCQISALSQVSVREQ